MGGPKSTAKGIVARKDGRALSAMKPKQQPQQPKRSGKTMTLKIDVDNLEPPSPHAFSTSPIEKHMVTPRSARRSSGRSFLQPDQFIAELKVKADRSELSINESPGSARSTGSVRSIRGLLSPPSPHFRKSPKPRLVNEHAGAGTQQVAAKRETMTRSGESGLGSLWEPSNSVPTLELDYEGKPAPLPSHLRVRTTAHSSSQPSATPELQKSSSQRSGRFFKGASSALLKLQATSDLLVGSRSPATMREKLVRSISGKKEGPSREADSSASVHSFNAGMSHSQPILCQPNQSQTMKSSKEAEENAAVKPAGRMRRMLHWGASKTGLEVLKSLDRKLGKKSSKVSSKTGEARIDVVREIREASERVEMEPETFDDGNWSPQSASSVSTTYSDVSSKSHSHKHSHHKKSAKSEAVKSKLWLLRVHQKLHGRPNKEVEEDSIYAAVRGATFHDADKKPVPGSARFNLEKNAIAKLVGKHKRNSTWDAGKFSPNDHLFSPKQPRLPKSDAHILLAPPKKLTGNIGESEFQQRRGKGPPLNTKSNFEAMEKSSSSPRLVSAPEPQAATSPATSQTITLRSTSPRQGVALPAVPSPRAPTPVSPAISEVLTPPISPCSLPASSKISPFGSFKGFNSPLPLPVRVGTVGLLSSPSSPIYPAPVSPRPYGSSATRQSTPTSPGLNTPSPGWTEIQSPKSPGVYGASPRSPGANADGAWLQSLLIAGLDSTRSLSQGSNSEEIFVLANSSFDSTSSGNSSIVPVSPAKPRGTQQPGPRARSRSASVVGRKTEPESEERNKRQSGSDNVILALPVPPRPPAVSFEQIVAGRGRSPPTDNTLMKFFFKCREIEHLNKFLALQKKRFLESLNTDSEKCFHMILSEADKGLSSMISTLCTAWLLENTIVSASVKWHPIPVLNMNQKDMWQHRDAAWLFHVCGIEAEAVLFLDEITSVSESVVPGRVKRAVAGKDILVTKGEVASSCTIVSERFRQEAPKLLQARFMKTLLLAGILVDTKNLSTGSSRDKQQATILLVGAGSLGRNGFYKHLVNIRDENYVTAFIKEIYGDSNALTVETPVQRGTQGAERPKSSSGSSQTDNGHHCQERKAEQMTPPSRRAQLRPPSLAIPNASSEAPASSSPRKPITILTCKSEPERKSEVDSKPSRKSEVKPKHKSEAEAKPSRKAVSSEVKPSRKAASSEVKKEGVTKISFGLRRFRN